MKKCIICNFPIEPFMSFGKIPIANGFLNKDQFANEYFFELKTASCSNCGMFQLLEQPSVYGTQKDIIDENCTAEDLKPQSPYAESKLKAEQLLSELWKSKGLKFATCRFGTIFGTSIGMRFHTAVNKFCWQAIMGEHITVWRTALNQKRAYLDVGDAVNAIQFIIQNELFDGKVYNVVTTNTTVGEITNIIKFYIPDLKIKFVDTKIMNQLSYHVSSQRFEKVGFKSCGNIEQRIKQTIELLKNSSQLNQNIFREENERK